MKLACCATVILFCVSCSSFEGNFNSLFEELSGMHHVDFTRLDSVKASGFFRYDNSTGTMVLNQTKNEWPIDDVGLRFDVFGRLTEAGIYQRANSRYYSDEFVDGVRKSIEKYLGVGTNEAEVDDISGARRSQLNYENGNYAVRFEYIPKAKYSSLLSTLKFIPTVVAIDFKLK